MTGELALNGRMPSANSRVKGLEFEWPKLVNTLALVTLSVYLIIRSIIRIRFYDELLYKIKLKKSEFAEFIE